MKDYFFLYEYDGFWRFELCIEHYMVSEDFKVYIEAFRFYKLTDIEGQDSEFTHRKMVAGFGRQKSITALFNDLAAADYKRINAKSYSRYKKELLSLYQKNITHEQATRTNRQPA